MRCVAVAVPSLGTGSRWGRRRIEKEDLCLLRRIWEDLPELRSPSRALSGQLAQGWGLGQQEATAPLWAQASGLCVGSPSPLQTCTPSSGQHPRRCRRSVWPPEWGLLGWAAGRGPRGPDRGSGSVEGTRGRQGGCRPGPGQGRGWFLLPKRCLGAGGHPPRSSGHRGLGRTQSQ